MVRSLGPDAQYDVIMTEVKLPDMNAYVLLQKLREVTAYVPLVMITGFVYDSDHTMLKVRGEGYPYVLYKQPFRAEQVEAAVEGMVERRQQMLADGAMRQ